MQVKEAIKEISKAVTAKPRCAKKMALAPHPEAKSRAIPVVGSKKSFSVRTGAAAENTGLDWL